MDETVKVTTSDELDQYARVMVRKVLDFWVDVAEEFDRIDAMHQGVKDTEKPDERSAREVS